MATITDEEEKTEFTFQELDERAKDTARQWHAETLYEDWYEFTKEEFHEKLESLGFDGIESCFSGFCSQGDGASFRAGFTFSEERAFEFLSDCDRERVIAAQAEAALAGHGWPKFVISGSLENRGNYCHANMICIDTISYQFETDSLPDELVDMLTPVEDAIDSPADNIRDYARDLANDYYEDLEKEYEYQTSDEALINEAESGGWTFDEYGNLN
jgi:hypothetical protein